MEFGLNTTLIGKIFPKGFDVVKEQFARNVASIIGYNVLGDDKTATVIDVDTNNIVPCQEVLDRTKVIELILYIRDKEVPGYPVGIKLGDEIYLLDGHHRVSAQILAVRMTVKMLITELNEDDEAVKTARNSVVNNKQTVIETPKVENTEVQTGEYKVFNKYTFRNYKKEESKK